jgi:signal transduction histidine kinase
MSMIQRMVSNLVDNAIKFTPFGGIVGVSFQEDGENFVSISVKDTGIGISEKDLPLIFERFYRGDPSRSLGGAGLGLSLARAIAQAHGGEIQVSSALGKGSTFIITMPKSTQSSS